MHHSSRKATTTISSSQPTTINCSSCIPRRTMIIFHQPVNHLYHITEQIAIHRDKSRNKKFDKKKLNKEETSIPNLLIIILGSEQKDNGGRKHLPLNKEQSKAKEYPMLEICYVLLLEVFI